MKMILSLMVLLSTVPSLAAVNCFNPATGATLNLNELSPHAWGSSPSPNAIATMNVTLASSLAGQGATSLQASEPGVLMIGRGLFHFQSTNLTVDNRTSDGGFAVSVSSGANFKFNPGECEIGQER